jgi:hypothetical protein
MLSPVELLPTREKLAALNVLAFLLALSNPATVNLLVLPPTICQASQKKHSTVSVFMVRGLLHRTPLDLPVNARPRAVAHDSVNTRPQAERARTAHRQKKEP